MSTSSETSSSTGLFGVETRGESSLWGIYLTCFQATMVKSSMLLRLFCSVEGKVMTGEMSALTIHVVEVGPHVRVHPVVGRLPRKKRCRRPGCRPLTLPSSIMESMDGTDHGIHRPGGYGDRRSANAADPAPRVRQWRLRLLCVEQPCLWQKKSLRLCALFASACALNATAGQKRDAPRKK